ncbi:DUF6797 domain-containing protein [Paraglaciecola aquimarina]|uniref:DUF6797 domain-containing protein n=1 Tax=Paraglaciecola aquimarina TaxID=1235557 RepID=A0ABU3SZB1_9ALTE|nr:DUF6797 domain-containing protein [Paraglaciecola aquimarina]MDU0355354.1 DUF6797 domain-containing protein [Paraglaciecola aquimarina]
MKKRLTATSLVLALLHFSSLAKPSDWWQTYDYSQVSAQVVSRGDDTPILRGRAVKLDTDEHAISAFYDVGSMNLRYVTLGSIQFKGTPWDGSHGGNSLIGGELFLQSGTLLAWTENDNWLDPRANDYAPLAKEYVHFKGSYRYNQQAIFHYTVGTQKAEVYEMPQTFYHQGQVVFVRHFQIEATSRPIKLKVLESSSSDLTPQITLHSPYHAIKSRDIINNTHLSEIQYIDIPASNQPQAFYIAYAQSKELPLIEKEDLLSKLSGGTTRWPQTVKLAGKLASDENENFVVDQIPLPIDNPYQSKIRFAGFDFFADGSRAAFSTWNGDVWIASGLDETLQNVTWKRYAAGINEALGIRIVDDIIYVTGKDQITRLHDINNDGEADYYENFNNDIKITANFS